MAGEPFWITVDDALLIHDRQLVEHSGPAGLRDPGLLKSALDRPQNLFAYGVPDLAELASYAFGLARNHPPVDGNKRTSFGVCLVFLDLNGFDLPAEHVENIATWQVLAAGTLAEVELAAWLRARMVPLD